MSETTAKPKRHVRVTLTDSVLFEVGSMTSAKLDAAVAVECMGWTLEEVPAPPGAEMPRRRWVRPSKGPNDLRPALLEGDWSPSTDIAAAFEVVERMRMDTSIFGRFCRALLNDFSEAGIDIHEDPTHDALGGVWWLMMNITPRAICEAALQAVRATNP